MGLMRAVGGVTMAGADDSSAPDGRDFPVLVDMADREEVPNTS
jgi:hypothetical protein